MFDSMNSRMFSSILLVTTILAATLSGFDPASAEDYSIRQITLNMKQDNSNKTLQDKLTKQIQESRLLYSSGNRELDSKDYDNAIASYQKAITLEPTFPPIHYNIGMAHLAIGNKKEASQHLRTFLTLRPNAFNAKEVHDLIKLLSN